MSVKWGNGQRMPDEPILPAPRLHATALTRDITIRFSRVTLAIAIEALANQAVHYTMQDRRLLTLASEQLIADLTDAERQWGIGIGAVGGRIDDEFKS